MARNHFYFGVKRTASMPQGAWDTLIAKIESTCSGTNDLVENRLQIRYNQNTPFDAAIYEANFDDLDISQAAIKQYLVTASGVAANRITIVTTTSQFAFRVNNIYAFRLDATVMFRMTVFGRNSDTQVLAWDDSRLECLAFLATNSLEWDGQ